MITAILSSSNIKSSSIEAFSLQSKSNIGEKRDNAIFYTPVESLFLIKQGKLSLIIKGKEVGEESARLKLRSIDKNIDARLVVYSDLRKKGYVLKEGLKFGGDFRVYKKGTQHSIWIVIVMTSKNRIDWRDFSAKNRVAHATGKKVLFSIIDDEEDITYYEVSWLKP